MNVLGLDIGSSACLVIDGSLKAFCQEERLIGLKKFINIFPSKSIQFCLAKNNITINDIDKIAISWGCNKYPFFMFAKLLISKAKTRVSLPSAERESGFSTALEYLLSYSPSRIRTVVKENLRIFGHKGKIPEIVFVEHHLSHAYQAYYQSPFKNAAILVSDGSGEEHCVSSYSMIDGRLKKIFQYDIPFSLGWYYGGFTAYLGFMANRDEGKFMGLAALGHSRKADNQWLERLDKILKVTETGFSLCPEYFKFGGNDYHPRYTDSLVNFITSYDPDLVPIGLGKTPYADDNCKYISNKYVDIAYAVQDRIERVVEKLACRLLVETGLDDLCFIGGTAMNCKINGYIRDNQHVKKLFVPPAASDEGACIGAAYYVTKSMGFEIDRNIPYTNLGPEFSNDEIIDTLNSCNISFTMPDDIFREAAAMIAQGKVIGWFQGGMEMGARALGCRSILANPRKKGVKNRLNSTIKYRESWRPFCPSVTVERANEYMCNPDYIPFMNVARKASRKILKEAPEIVHVDGTIRPQTVDKKDNRKFHNLLESVNDEIGLAMVLNTSFNIRGKPIVYSPRDALEMFYTTNLDAIVLGDILIRK